MAFWDGWFSGSNNDAKGTSALDAAVATGNLYDIQQALNAGADPNQKSGGGNTPLLVAAVMGNRDMVAKLMDLGGQVEFNAAATPVAATETPAPAATTKDIEIRKPLTFKRKGP